MRGVDGGWGCCCAMRLAAVRRVARNVMRFIMRGGLGPSGGLPYNSIVHATGKDGLATWWK
jgi:hypothetical protein